MHSVEPAEYTKHTRTSNVVGTRDCPSVDAAAAADHFVPFTAASTPAPNAPSVCTWVEGHVVVFARRHWICGVTVPDRAG